MAPSSLLYQAQQTGPKSQNNEGSFLSFASSQVFREELMIKNLKPYNIVGINSEPQGTVIYQQTPADLSASEVIFSVDNIGLPPIFRNENPNSPIVPSSYSAYNILKNTNPTGSNGPLSQDSYIAKIGSQVLKSQLLETNAFYLKQNLENQNSVSFKITSPDINDTFLSALEGSYVPASSIPGDYFLDGLNKRTTDTLGEAINLVAGRSTILGGVFNGSITRAINPSQILLQYTDDGQKGIMFSNLSYNIYRPAYGDSLVGGIGGSLLTTGINNLLDNFGLQLPGAYYVGTPISEPSFATSPINAVPIDVYGRDTQAIVFGPDVLGKDYEGNEGKINFGLQSKALINQGNFEGDLTWVSPKYKSGNDAFWSTNIDFRPGSILDDTQRLIDSADRLQGDRRLMHVGNAINQTSTIFHDGYKKITKGSQVKSVTYNDGRAIVGEEYCRIFTKDNTYSTNNRLQKKDGIVDFGRRFDNSVLNKTYNLNIYPTKATENGRPSWLGENSVKKYMFSIENLAWKDSKRPGYNVQDLPLCERGPNGGRIMWFPPYDLKFNDNSSADFQATTFLGRPEPVYTYKSTSRNGTLSWKIVVDHPSVLNLIVDKVLAGESESNADEVIESFFAGCQTYDLYELAAKFNTASLNDIQFLQESIQRSTPEEQILISEAIPVVKTESATSDIIVQNEVKSYDFGKYNGLGFYFDNDIPKIGSGESYETLYNQYIGQISTYRQKTKQSPDSISTFFNNVITNNYTTFTSGPQDPGLFLTIYQALTENSVKYVEIQMEGSASSSASEDYNQKLSERRIDSVKEFLKTFTILSGSSTISLSNFIDQDKLRISYDAQGELAKNVTPIGGSSPFANVASCTEQPKINGVELTNQQAIYVTDSMACRSVRIKSINAPAADPTTRTEKVTTTKEVQSSLPGPKMSIKPNTKTEVKRIPGLSKKVLRMLLSECNYFQAMEDESPFLYKSLKEKLKYFHPSFHSTTPEGLNSRLTFLNQCLRPGDTIPTIGTDGRPIYNDAINTAFGRPPVLVLRIGDFYNTKIIPESLQISYDPLVLDMNREGIGLQPMIAMITLSFKIIGGMGLARPVEELQNALSFNYYANTEIYDERSTATEDVSELDAIIANSIINRQPEVKSNVTNVANQQQNPGGTTIGNILTTNSNGADVFGTIDYNEFLDNNINSLQNYFNNLVQTSKSVSDTYNYYVWRYANCERIYTSGTLGGENAKLYGIPKNLERIFDNLFGEVLSDIFQNTNPIIEDFINRGFNEVVIRQLKQNLINFVDLQLKPEFISTLNQQLLLAYQNQNDVIVNSDKCNYIKTTYDGSIKTDGSTTIYNITGGTEWNDINTDFVNFASDTINFLNLLNSKNIVNSGLTVSDSINFQTEFINNDIEKKFFTIISQSIIDINNLQRLSDYLFPNGNIIGNVDVNSPLPPKDFFETIVGLRPITTVEGLRFGDTYNNRYEKAKKDLSKHIDEFITSDQDYKKNYEKYFNFRKITTSRVVNYNTSPTPPDSAKTQLQQLYQSVQTTGDNFNGKIF